MRKISLFMNVSLDGYIEDANGDISGFTHDFEAFSAGGGEVDTLLLGHKTYEQFKFWGTPEGAAMQPDVAKFITETHKVVVSHTAFEPGWQNVTVLSENPIESIKQLKTQPGKTIMIFGSNTLCASLIPHGLIDEFQIQVNPVVFGAGTTLFAGLSDKTNFTLKETHPFQSGAVLLTYIPVPSPVSP